MRAVRTLALTVAASALLAGCVSGGPKQTIGVFGGAAAGGLIGGQIGHGDGRLVATGLGVLLGALAGSEIGASLDRADQVYADRAFADAMETQQSGSRIAWNNPDTGHSGWIEPAGAVPGRSACRGYRQTIYIDGRPQAAEGVACRTPDGAWEIR